MKHSADGSADGVREFADIRKWVRILKYSPTPMIQTIAGMPQIKLLTAELMVSIV